MISFKRLKLIYEVLLYIFKLQLMRIDMDNKVATEPHVKYYRTAQYCVTVLLYKICNYGVSQDIHGAGRRSLYIM